jgi:hypothetical protein
MCEEDKMSSAPLSSEKKSMIRTARGYFELFCGVGKKVFDFLDGPGLEKLQSNVANARAQLRNLASASASVPPSTAVGGKRRKNKKLKMKTQKRRR